MEQSNFKALLRRTVAVPIIALAILAGVLLWEIHSLTESMQWVDHTDQVISTSLRAMELIIDMESSVREYLNTGEDEFLPPYNKAKLSINSEFEILNRLISDNPAQQARLAAIRSRFGQWQIDADRAIEVRRSIGESTYDVDVRKQLMDSVRSEDDSIIAAEEQLRTERLQAAHNASRLVTVTCTLLSLGIGVILAVFTRRRMHLLGAEFQESLDIAEKRAEELREREEAVRSSQAKLQGIVDSAMDAVISVDEQQHIIVFNRAAEAVFQCAASETLGSTLDRFIPAPLSEVHHDHIGQFGTAGVTARSMTSPRILNAVRSNGKQFPIEATISQVMADGEKIFTVILRDITRRKQAEEALRASEHRWSTTLRSIGDAVISTDAVGNIEFMNDVAQRLTGWSLPEARGRDLIAVFDII